MITIDKPITYQGEKYSGTEEIGFKDIDSRMLFWISLKTGERGRYSTSIPISSKNYRKEHGTQARALHTAEMIIIYDDHNTKHVIEADPEVHKLLIEELRAEDLFK